MIKLWTLSAIFLFSCNAVTLLAATALDLTAQDLGTLGGSYSFARDINQSSVVIGEAETKNQDIHAFRWSAGLMDDPGLFGAFRATLWRP